MILGSICEFIATVKTVEIEKLVKRAIRAALLCGLAIFVLCTLGPEASAQSYLSQIGSPVFTTAHPVKLGFVNIGNGNLHQEITLGSFPQRGGHTFVAKLVYDSRIWQIVSGTSNTWQPTNVQNSQGGWRFVTSADTGTTSNLSGTGLCVFNHARVPNSIFYENFTWTAPDGTVHSFPIHTVQVIGPCGGNGVANADAFATDSSGFHMYVTNFNVSTVFAPDGTEVFPIVEDTNGNVLSKDPNGNGTDTLGRTPVTKTVNGSQTTYAILNSQGSSANVVVTTGSKSVSTAFGQSGVTEFSGAITVIQSVKLPDGNSYSFVYDSYGELSGITLPTGGQITYAYGNFNDGLGGANRWVSSHASGGGTTTFGQAVQSLSNCLSGSQACQSQTVTRSDGTQAVYTFGINNGAWKSQVQYSSGGSQNTVFETIADTWNFSNSCQLQNCSGAQNIQKLTETTTFPTATGSLSKSLQLTYDSVNDQNISKILEFNFSAPNLERETDITYLATLSYTAKNIINRVLSTTVKDGSGNLIAQTNLKYDDSGTLVATSPATGIVHHDDTNFGISNTVRGNLTQVQRCTVLSSCSAFLSAKMTYDTTGNVVSTQDVAGNISTLGYSDNFFTDSSPAQNPPQAYTPAAPTNAYLTSATSPLIGASTFGYYFGTGKSAFSRDPNGADSYDHFLDSLDRLTNVYGPVAPNGSRPWTLTAYSSTEVQIDGYLGITDTSPSPSCVSCRHSQTKLDNLGRPISQTLMNDPEGATTVNTNYDTSGRVLSSSHPFRSSNDPTYGLETPTYDTLSRVIKIAHQDNTFSQVAYGAAVLSAGGLTAQLCSSSTYGLGYPVFSLDEAGKKHEVWLNGFGRSIETDEPDTSGNLTSPTCNKFDLQGNLTQTVHGTQTRSYTYDPLSRLTVSITPESGTTNFYYTAASGGLCTGKPAATCRRTDARSITTTYAYDALNRLTGVTYSDTTPAVAYSYDQGTNPQGQTQKGFRTGMTDGSGSTAWTYDLAGRVLTEHRTIAGVTKTITHAYNLDGSIATLTYPSGHQVAYTVSNAQRPTSATDIGTGTQYAITASYAAIGALQSVIAGKINAGFGGITETHTYNNRLEYTGTQASSSTGTALNLSVGYNLPGGNNGSVASITNNVDNGRTQTIQYDPLNRISSAASQATSGADCWGQSFGVDPLANLTSVSLTQCSGNTLSVTVNGNNQFTSLAYDAAGNTSSDGTFAYTYDAEKRITSAAGVIYTYDGNGLRVKKSNGTLYWRSISGNAIAETDLNGNVTSEYIFFAGRRVARLDTSANVFYYFPDPLGTTRTITDKNGNVCYDADFTPYGQELNHTNSCPQNYKFTGYERDPETGNDYAFARYYNPRLGRFLSPDPLSGSLGDPQSLNRYAYTRNDPANNTDPSGTVNVPNYRGLGGGGGGFGFLINLYFALGYGSMGGNGCQADGVDTPCSLVFGLLGAGAAVQCPNNVCLGVNRDNLPIQFVAPLGTGGYYECLISGSFSTQQAAGIAAVGCANGPSIATNREIVGNIYSIDSNGMYSFTLGTPQGPASGNVDFSDIPDNTEFAGFYHTHGAFDVNYYSERFSGFEGDIGVAFSPGNQGFPTYLGTPGGRVEMFDPAQFGAFPNGCVLVGSPVSPGPGISEIPVPICQP